MDWAKKGAREGNANGRQCYGRRRTDCRTLAEDRSEVTLQSRDSTTQCNEFIADGRHFAAVIDGFGSELGVGNDGTPVLSVLFTGLSDVSDGLP